MYCTHCGTQHSDGPGTCTSCGQVLPHFPAKVQNYLVPSILVTLCCCAPVGIPAIVFAAQVNSKLQAGDLTGATESAHKARMWCWIAFGVGLAGTLFYLAMALLGAVVEA